VTQLPTEHMISVARLPHLTSGCSALGHVSAFVCKPGTCHNSAYLSADLRHLSLNIDRFPSALGSFSLSLLLFLILIPELADIVIVYIVSMRDGRMMTTHTDEFPAVLPDVVEITGVSTESISVTGSNN